MMMLRAAGAFLVVMGSIWALQGLGLLNWPADSFMLAQREWALYGALTATGGAMVLWLSVRLGRPRD
jgi:hypothetical protein